MGTLNSWDLANQYVLAVIQSKRYVLLQKRAHVLLDTLELNVNQFVHQTAIQMRNALLQIRAYAIQDTQEMGQCAPIVAYARQFRILTVMLI